MLVKSDPSRALWCEGGRDSLMGVLRVDEEACEGAEAVLASRALILRLAILLVR